MEKFKSFVTKRVIGGVLLTVFALWVFGMAIGFFNSTVTTSQGVKTPHANNITGPPKCDVAINPIESAKIEKKTGAEHVKPVKPASQHTTAQPVHQAHQAETVESKPSAATHDQFKAKTYRHEPSGVAFVNAVIKPLDYELGERFWGWRPNDILNFTDNINNFQLGVLEVTRRTAVMLAERISRTGSTAAFDKNLERAMNWFMIKADKYWFPSPESKYNAGLKELRAYKDRLEKGRASFYIRSDNLIPLLAAYEDLLGSCDENLVKTLEEGGVPVSFFAADDYFYYTKGVASAMLTVLEAIQEDFSIILETRHGTEILHHAIESCHHAIKIEPWLITESSLSGIFANHRANMAAPISHARFYIGVLIKTLST